MGACEREMARAAQAENIPLSVLYAVGLTETGQRGLLQPYAMNIDGAARVAQSLPEAAAMVRQAQARGAKLIDIGCMQINQRYHGAHFPSLEAMFDTRRNVAYAAHFLKELRAREPSWTLAVARYNAGPDNNRAQKKYVCAVIGNMVRAGLGAWTEPARKFCAPGGA
jgi:soluble lytic murein transglycosylase-like protein